MDAAMSMLASAFPNLSFGAEVGLLITVAVTAGSVVWAASKIKEAGSILAVTVKSLDITVSRLSDVIDGLGHQVNELEKRVAILETQNKFERQEKFHD